MLDPSAMLNEIVTGQKIFGIVITDAFQGTVFPILCLKVIHDRHADLHIGVVDIILS